MNRQRLVARYLALQDEAMRLGLVGTPHITAHMSDSEIVRLGKLLAALVEKAKANGKTNGQQSG